MIIAKAQNQELGIGIVVINNNTNLFYSKGESEPYELNKSDFYEFPNTRKRSKRKTSY